jgi:hypothetical protein
MAAQLKRVWYASFTSLGREIDAGPFRTSEEARFSVPKVCRGSAVIYPVDRKA